MKCLQIAVKPSQEFAKKKMSLPNKEYLKDHRS